MFPPNLHFSAWLRMARLASFTLSFTSACTVEHLEVGVDRDGLGNQTTSPGSTGDVQCPEECAVSSICRLCDDDSCARAEVSCNADGSCGSVDWICPNDPTQPGEPVCPDVCEAVCNGKPEPQVPDGCPLPECQCEPDPSCECEVPAICRECSDGTCAEPLTKCNADGSCELLDWVCDEPSVPACPDPELLCQAQCKGDVLDVAPDCPVTSCECKPEPPTCECAVPEICKVCDDGTCAQPNVSCDADGKCGDVLFTCKPVDPTPTCDCAIDAICKLCPDGSCAVGTPLCNPDGSCDARWTCPGEEELYDCDTSQVACDLAIDCEPGLVPTSNGSCYGPCVKPEQCAPQKYDCDTTQVACERAEPQCESGLVPTHVNGCFGPCVSRELCTAPVGTCPEQCPVIDICKLCSDGSCAAAEVMCNADGSCGQTTWTCPDEPATDECAKLCATSDAPAVEGCVCDPTTACPDVCAALCSRDPLPELPPDCPLPSCVCAE